MPSVYVRCTAGTVRAKPRRVKDTRGLADCAIDAHETKTPLVGSSVQLRWTCSGVPSGEVGNVEAAARPTSPGAAEARPMALAPARKDRREKRLSDRSIMGAL